MAHFSDPPKRILELKKNAADFIEKVAHELGIKQPEDWYKFRAKEIVDRGGLRFLIAYGSYYHLLQSAYPKFTFDVFKFQVVPRGYPIKCSC